MRFVDDHSKALAGQIGRGLRDHGKLLQCGDDDRLAFFQRLFELGRCLFDGYDDARLLLGNCLIVFCNCASRTRRSVTTMIESNRRCVSSACWYKLASWCASHAIEFDLPDPAECCTR